MRISYKKMWIRLETDLEQIQKSLQLSGSRSTGREQATLFEQEKTYGKVLKHMQQLENEEKGGQP